MKIRTMPLFVFPALAIIILGLFYVAYILIFHAMNPPLPKSTVTIGDHAFEVEIASTALEKARGLSGRERLADNQGMFFEFDAPGVQNFWMKDMLFPIDIIWIAKDKVVGFAENATPQPSVALWKLKIYTSPASVNRVLEVNAGTVAQTGIKIGDSVRVSL